MDHGATKGRLPGSMCPAGSQSGEGSLRSWAILIIHQAIISRGRRRLRSVTVHSGFDMIFAHILEDVMRKVSDRKRIMISADNAFQRTGLTGLRIPGIECAARIGQRQKITLPAFFIIPRLRAGDFGNAGEIKQSGVKLHLFPAQPQRTANR